MKDKRGRGSVYLEIYGGLLFVALRMAALSPEFEPAIVNIVGVPPAPCTEKIHRGQRQRPNPCFGRIEPLDLDGISKIIHVRLGRARVERKSTTCSPSVQQRPHRLGGPHRCPFLEECMHGRAAYTPSHRERRQRRRPSADASRRPRQMPSTSVTLHHIFVGRIGHRRRWPYTNWDGAARTAAASLVSLLTFSYSNSLQ